jgi:hypothetical protein
MVDEGSAQHKHKIGRKMLEVMLFIMSDDIL